MQLVIRKTRNQNYTLNLHHYISTSCVYITDW